MADPNDVVCVCKRYASDNEPAQRPVLVLPQSFLSRLPSPLPSNARPDKVTAADRRASWLELATILLRQKPLEGEQLVRAVKYLQWVGEGRGTPEGTVLQPLPWHVSEKPRDVLQGLASYPVLLPVAAFKAQLRR